MKLYTRKTHKSYYQYFTNKIFTANSTFTQCLHTSDKGTQHSRSLQWKDAAPERAGLVLALTSSKAGSAHTATLRVNVHSEHQNPAEQSLRQGLRHVCSSSAEGPPRTCFCSIQFHWTHYRLINHYLTCPDSSLNGTAPQLGFPRPPAFLLPQICSAPNPQHSHPRINGWTWRGF